MQSDILFDNIYIGHSVEDAEKLKAETYDIKHTIEVAEEEATKPPPEKESPKSPMDLKFMDDPVHYVREKVDLFWAIAKNDPVEAVKALPEVAGGIGALAATIIALIIGIVGVSSAPPPKVQKAAEKVKQSALDIKDQVVDAASSGADKAQAEVNKRTTRSSGPAE